MRRSTRIDGSAGGEPLSCGNQSTYNRVANAGNLHRLSPFQMPFGILHNLTGKSSLTFPIEKCHFITAISACLIRSIKEVFFLLHLINTGASAHGRQHHIRSLNLPADEAKSMIRAQVNRYHAWNWNISSKKPDASLVASHRHNKTVLKVSASQGIRSLGSYALI